MARLQGQGSRIVQLNRWTRITLDKAAIVQKFGVSPASIPDYLALVGDTADGYPELPGWGREIVSHRAGQVSAS